MQLNYPSPKPYVPSYLIDRLDRVTVVAILSLRKE